MAAVRRSAVYESLHVLVEPVHVERAVLHADVDVVCPDFGVGCPLVTRKHVAGMAAEVVDGLVLFQ